MWPLVTRTEAPGLDKGSVLVWPALAALVAAINIAAAVALRWWTVPARWSAAGQSRRITGSGFLGVLRLVSSRWLLRPIAAFPEGRMLVSERPRNSGQLSSRLLSARHGKGPELSARGGASVGAPVSPG